jgi:hypothetical protein
LLTKLGEQILDKSPARLRHLELDSFTVMNDPRAQALLDKLADGSITSVRFVAYRGRSCFDELYGALPLLSKIMKLQIDDFDWTEEVRSAILDLVNSQLTPCLRRP